MVDGHFSALSQRCWVAVKNEWACLTWKWASLGEIFSFLYLFFPSPISFSRVSDFSCVCLSCVFVCIRSLGVFISLHVRQTLSRNKFSRNITFFFLFTFSSHRSANIQPNQTNFNHDQYFFFFSLSLHQLSSIHQSILIHIFPFHILFIYVFFLGQTNRPIFTSDSPTLSLRRKVRRDDKISASTSLRKKKKTGNYFLFTACSFGVPGWGNAGKDHNNSLTLR